MWCKHQQCPNVPFWWLFSFWIQNQLMCVGVACCVCLCFRLPVCLAVYGKRLCYVNFRLQLSLRESLIKPYNANVESTGFWLDVSSYQAQLTVTFKFSCTLMLLTVWNNKVRHTYLGQWLIMKSECSPNEAAAKMLNAYNLESRLCANACIGVFVSSVDLDRRRHIQLSAFIIRQYSPESFPLYSLWVDVLYIFDEIKWYFTLV